MVLARNETAEALAGLSHARATCACWIGSKGICFAVGYSTSDVCVWGVPPPVQQGQSSSLCSIKACISCFSVDSWTQATSAQLPPKVACLLAIPKVHHTVPRPSWWMWCRQQIPIHQATPTFKISSVSVECSGLLP